MAFDSIEYWKARYAGGGNSGSGSYGKLAEFKAASLNSFIEAHKLGSIIEFGSGDGNQLGLIKIAKYLGLDVSLDAISRVRELYQGDSSKAFQTYDPQTFKVTAELKSDLAISMDVILHLTEDERYEKYMNDLFESATRYVGIFNTATDVQLPNMSIHNKFRDHRRWISLHRETASEIQVDLVPESIGYPEGTGFYYYALNEK